MGAGVSSDQVVKMATTQDGNGVNMAARGVCHIVEGGKHFCDSAYDTMMGTYITGHNAALSFRDNILKNKGQGERYIPEPIRRKYLNRAAENVAVGTYKVAKGTGVALWGTTRAVVDHFFWGPEYDKEKHPDAYYAAKEPLEGSGAQRERAWGTPVTEENIDDHLRHYERWEDDEEEGDADPEEPQYGINSEFEKDGDRVLASEKFVGSPFEESMWAKAQKEKEDDNDEFDSAGARPLPEIREIIASRRVATFEDAKREAATKQQQKAAAETSTKGRSSSRHSSSTSSSKLSEFRIIDTSSRNGGMVTTAVAVTPVIQKGALFPLAAIGAAVTLVPITLIVVGWYTTRAASSTISRTRRRRTVRS